MKRTILSLLAAALLVFLALPIDMLAAPPPGLPSADSGSAPQEIMVRFKTGTTLWEMAAAHRYARGRWQETIPGLEVQVIQVPAATAARSIRRYAANPRVIYAEPNYIARAVAEPDDPYFSSQWGMYKVEAPAAWDTTTGSATVTVAILDTGVDQDHPDLIDKIVKNANFTTSRTVDDRHGHGTHVAGIAAASTNNGLGVAGLGYDSSIMNVKVLGDDGSGYYSWVINGIIWAADNGAQVINMSLGGSAASSALQDAVNYAWSKGAVITAAAGNSGSSSPLYPAYYANCLAVAATDSYDRKASWSNYGDWVDVAAPGVSILSTVKGNSYGYMSGTSMASPHVAGLAALVFTTVGDDNGNGLLNDEVRDRIEFTCDDIGISGIGSGRINAARAVQGEQVEPLPDVQIVKTADPTSVSEAGTVITYTCTVTNIGDADLTGIAVTDDMLGNVSLGTTALNPATSTSGTATYTVTQSDIDSGANIINIATVTTDQGVTDTDSATVTVDAPEPPVAGVDISPAQHSATAAPGETVQYTYTVSNTGNEDDTYSLAVTAGWTASASPASLSIAAGQSADVIVSHTVPGTATEGDSDAGTLTATSDRASATAAFTTTAREEPEPVAPVIDVFNVTNNSNRIWARVTVDWAVSDADGDLATVAVLMVLNESIVDSATYSVSGYEASGSSELRHRSRRGGTYEIRLTVTDALGNTDSRSEWISS